MRSNLVVAGIVAAALGAASTPSAAQEACVVGVSPSMVVADEVFYVTGTGFAPESFPTITISRPDGTGWSVDLEEFGQDLHRTDAAGVFGPLDFVESPDPGQPLAELVGTLRIELSDDTCAGFIDVQMVDSPVADADPQVVAEAYRAVVESYMAETVMLPLDVALGEAGEDITELAAAYGNWATWADDLVAAVRGVDIPAEASPQLNNFTGTLLEFAGINRSLAEEPFSETLSAERLAVMANLADVVDALGEVLG